MEEGCREFCDDITGQLVDTLTQAELAILPEHAADSVYARRQANSA